MSKNIEEDASEILEDIEIDIEMEGQDIEITDEIEELIERIENADKSYRLALDDQKLYLKISSLLFRNGQIKRAEDFAKKALKIDNSYEGFMLRGNTLYEYRDYKGALGYYNEALKYKQDKNTYLHKAKALRKRDMFERALESIEKAIKIEKDPELIAMYADTLVDLNRIEEAERFYSKAEELGGKTDHKRKKIKALLDKAKDQSIPENFDKILRLDEECKEAWIGKAEKLWNMDRMEEAIECLEDAEKKLDKEEITNKLEEYKENSLNKVECEKCGGTGECTFCDGTGDCVECGGSGNCEECGGTAYCPNCDGTAECANCGGSGRTGLFSKCEVCNGDGICIECGGHGMCEVCDGTGNCIECGGNGNCKECQGSGDCTECEGKGYITESTIF
ncbi:MAG: hypothetical protein ACOCSL_04765 [Thermoplasmatota archaeon]